MSRYPGQVTTIFSPSRTHTKNYRKLSFSYPYLAHFRTQAGLTRIPDKEEEKWEVKRSLVCSTFLPRYGCRYDTQSCLGSDGFSLGSLLAFFRKTRSIVTEK